MKKISVIIPCYNAEKYIETCLESLEKQTIGIENLEIILVNDASTDRTGLLIEQFEQKHPENVMVIHLDNNCKQGGARNVGLSYVSGEYVIFLDADDWIETDFYEALYQIATEYDTDIVQFPMTTVTQDEDGNTLKTEMNFAVKGSGLYEIDSIEERKHFLMEKRLPCGSQSKLYKKAFLDQMQPRFVEGVAYEEPSFVYPLLFSVKKYYWYEKPKYICRVHRASTMQSYVRQKGKLYDHPYVQLHVYEQMKQNLPVYQTYRDEIDFYFLFTFYFETVQFAKQGGLYLGYDYFQMMQKVLWQMIPDWVTNAYMQMFDNTDVRELIIAGQRCENEEQFAAFLQG